MSTSAVYPPGIAPALGHLHSSRNDIQIFVEDTATKNMWRELLKNFVPKGTKFCDPIQLGGKTKVLEECKKDQLDDGRRKLYIVDADFDLLKGKKKPRLKHLYRLRAYCIENYLLSAEGLVQIGMVLDVNASEEEVGKSLDFERWKETNVDLFRRIFVCYATCHEISPQHQTIGYFVGRLALPNPQNDCLCALQTAARVVSLYRLLLNEFTRSGVDQVYRKVLQNAFDIDVYRYVSGKDYIFPLICARLRRLFGRQLSDEQIKVLLARSTSKKVDPFLSRRLKSICEAV